MSNKLQYISLLRVIATLFVVLFHSYEIYFYNIGLDYKFQFVEIYKWFFLVEERIQMPLFAFIAGFLFEKQVSRFSNLASLIKSKSERLLLPYIVFGVLFYYTFPSSVSKSIVPYESIGHLWFILMLFWLFPIQYMMKEFDFKFQIALAIFMNLVSLKMPYFLCISQVCNLFVFFNIAYNWKYIYKYTNGKFELPIALFLSLFVILIFTYRENTFIWNLLQKVVYLLCSYFWLFVIMSISKGYTIENKVILNLDRASFGIYIFHCFIMFHVLNYFDIVRQFAVKHYIVYPIYMFLFLVLTSWLVTVLVLKVKYINKLI